MLRIKTLIRKMKEHLAAFKPFVKASEKQTEFSIRALILGILLSLLFAVGNAYLGLKVGMTISASIPAAPQVAP